MRRETGNKKQIVLLSVLLCIVTVFGIFQYKEASELRYLREIEYNRVFSELTEYVDDLEISLLKGQIVTSPQQIAKLSSELYRQASGAKANLALLPMGGNQLEKTNEFLSQVGEYANSISFKMLRGEKMSEEEVQTLKNLANYAASLRNGFDRTLLGINDGRISFEEEKNRLVSAINGSETVMTNELMAMEEEFHNYPSLIYDGPFSQHLTLKESVFTEGKPEITQKQAISLARKFIGNGKCETTQVGGKLPAISVKSENVTLEYTKNGGILLLLMKDRQPDEEKLGIDEAKKKAEAFLRENGFDSMKESYYDNREGSIIINYAYEQNGYTVFPDLVKVKVALDNGEILGFESRGYIMNHIYRNIPDPKITEKDALKNINPALKAERISMAVIPLESGGEACCYVIRGKVSEKNFLVFVNTQTGYVEDMQILIETPGGILAV